MSARSSDPGLMQRPDQRGPGRINPRDCAHCGLSCGPSDDDPCIDGLPGVMNACCGHGTPEHAYVQFSPTERIGGQDAIDRMRAIGRDRVGMPSAATAEAIVEDGCEWDPDAARAARGTESHHRTTPAAVMVGANVDWRLCSSCAALPRFKRFRVRRPVVKRPVIMVDELKPYPLARHRCFRAGACHLTADGTSPEHLAALHALASRIGMKRSWFQEHRLAAHYDLTTSRRAAALAAGAVFVPAMEQARVRIARRNAAP